MVRFITAPQSAAGYICHLEEHWFTIRSVDGMWWNFDSLLPAPARVGEAYLETYLFTLRQQDWSIYVVEGQLPSCRVTEAGCAHGPGRLWTHAQVHAFCFVTFLACPIFMQQVHQETKLELNSKLSILCESMMSLNDWHAHCISHRQLCPRPSQNAIDVSSSVDGR
jgi:hypothetical protein